MECWSSDKDAARRPNTLFNSSPVADSERNKESLSETLLRRLSADIEEEITT